eukprot:TRINITY_DN57_c0_g1_i3.p1 TRINITY_DN57_c0_g1~~TRINITY_DN57_c0_g1_i3.p1  ORF type:complete len:289 (+),score=83.31 TRINITY_DN57_c0_g1_i3:83-949(+)
MCIRDRYQRRVHGEINILNQSKKRAMAKGGKKKTVSKSQKRSDKVKKNPLFEKRPRNFRIGGDIRPRTDLTRFVRWPKYILLQRQKRILLQRLKIPPVLNQFNLAIDRNQASSLLRLLNKYVPETKEAKRKRLLEEAKTKAETGKGTKKNDKSSPLHLQYGLNHITSLIENKTAKLVVIAHDVDPIELILWLPSLCRKMDVPYCIIRGKARLGKLVNKKTATAVALTSVRKEDNPEFESLVKTFRSQFNDNKEALREWGGGILGIKSQHKRELFQKAIEAETLKKAGI